MAEQTNPNPKITPYRRRSWLNIGTILFGAIFVYMVITMINYLTATRITSYEVVAGTISGNYHYTALALKSEQILRADFAGYVQYYARDAARVGVGMTICSIDENETPRNLSDVALTEEDYHGIHTRSSTFARTFTDNTFQDIYTFKADLQSSLLQAADPEALQSSYITEVVSPESGFVSYTIDGMEGLSEADLSSSLFNRTNYDSINLRLNKSVRMGDMLCKLITGDTWYLYFPISSEMATALQERTSIRFRFLKDDTTFSAPFSILYSEGSGYFGKIELRNSLVRYVPDRNLEIELLMDSRKGLKIPVSSISEKTFLKIPQEYVIANSDSSKEITMLRETFRNDGSSSVDYITATVYDKQDRYYLVSQDLFKMGDYVQRTNTTKKHQIVEEDLVTIQGVYNINKGYAVFRQVNIIDENNEFCIVEPYNVYGLAAHDYIVLDASKVSDDSIVA